MNNNTKRYRRLAAKAHAKGAEGITISIPVAIGKRSFSERLQVITVGERPRKSSRAKVGGRS